MGTVEGDALMPHHIFPDAGADPDEDRPSILPIETRAEEYRDTLISLHSWLRDLPYKAPEVIDEERQYYMGLIEDITVPSTTSYMAKFVDDEDTCSGCGHVYPSHDPDCHIMSAYEEATWD